MIHASWNAAMWQRSARRFKVHPDGARANDHERTFRVRLHVLLTYRQMMEHIFAEL